MKKRRYIYVKNCKIFYNSFWKLWDVSYSNDGYPCGNFKALLDAIEEAQKAS